MKRRQFIHQVSFATAGLGLIPHLSIANIMGNTNFGVALFTLPKSLSEDFEGTLKMIADSGYKDLEFFGPYDFSTPAAKEGWKVAATALGFSGSGYFGHSSKALRSMLEKILATAKEAGVKHFFLEKDLTPEPEKALQNSFEHLSGLKL